MQLEDYLRDKESVAKSVAAFEGRFSFGANRKGTLAVTPNRVVFVRNKAVSDISLNGVDSIQYRAPTFPPNYLLGAVACLCLSLLFYLLGAMEGAVGELSGLLASIFFLSAIILVIIGALLMRATLILNTGNKQFEYVSRDRTLADIAHALRGYEQG